MKAILAGVALAVVFGSSAYADYYIVQEPSTKRCRIVEERPAPGIGVVIGAPFGVRVEAENHLRSVEVCREGTTGRGEREGDTVIIDRR